MDLNLKGRCAVVTGGGKGIGAGISKALAAEGVRVLINCNSNPTMAEATAKEIIESGGEAVVYPTDVSDRAQVDAMMKKANELFGTIDILVNNAAWQPNLDIDEYKEETFDEIMNINLGGYFRCIQAVLPYMKDSKCGRIINISSVHGKRPGDFDPGYSMAKGAIKMLTREAALEYAAYGITVNQILPGAVMVEFKSGVSGPFKMRRLKRERQFKFFPLNHVGVPEDIANTVLFIASERSLYMSGTSMRLDGGSMLL
ncbi:MAG TPA: SDR family oxidoreductase [Clostridiaceae bacterium]